MSKEEELYAAVVVEDIGKVDDPANAGSNIIWRTVFVSFPRNFFPVISMVFMPATKAIFVFHKPSGVSGIFSPLTKTVVPLVKDPCIVTGEAVTVIRFPSGKIIFKSGCPIMLGKRNNK